MLCLSLCSSRAKISQWSLIPFVCPSPAPSLRRRRAAWALWWCPTSCPPPCIACPPSPPPPRASPAAPRPLMDSPACHPKSQSLHPLRGFFAFTVYFKPLFCIWLNEKLFVFLDVHLSDYVHAAPCCPVPATAGPRFCPAQRKTTGFLERTGRTGVWANRRSYWRGRLTQMW